MEKTATDPEIDIRVAEREVQSAKARLGAELEIAKKTGQRALTNLTQRARPVLIGVAAVGGLLIVAGIVRVIRGALARPRRPRFAFSEPRRSMTRQMFDAAITSAASAVASAAARKSVEKLKNAGASTESTAHLS